MAVVPRRYWWQAVLGVLVRPWLWPVALRQGAAMTRPGWWRQPPYLPRPDPGYLRFRLETAYGANGPADPADLVRYLEWCRRAPRR